jgi:outer membrane lipoprotein SlyB
MKKQRIAQVAGLVLVSALATGCASPSLTGSAYSQADARKVQTIRYGTVTSVTPVVIEGRKDGVVGTGAGAIIGGIAGSTVGGGRGSSIATVIGAVAGGLAGSKIEENTTRKQGQEVQIRLASGQEISVVQEVENQRFFQVGDQVRILEGRGATRVTY